MKFDRALLLKAADIAKPALASKELIEELCHFFFDGQNLTAYNDATLGIQVPFVSELKGGIRGSVLLGILTHTRAKEIDLEIANGHEAHIKAGRMKLKLSLLDPKRAVHELPDLKKTKGYRTSKEFLKALKDVMVSIGNSNAIPEQLGVTIQLQGGLQFFATDSKTIAWATVKDNKDWPLKPGQRVTLPTPFIEQLLRLADEATFIFLTTDNVVAITGEKVKLFARLVDVPKPNDFIKIANDCMKGVNAFDIPSRLKLALERAGIMVNGQQDEAIAVKIQADQLFIQSNASFGELKDSIRLEEEPGEVTFRVNPEMMKRALDLCTKVTMTENTTIMTGKNFVYLISNFGA